MNKVEYPEDCIRIRNCLNIIGYDASLIDAENLWNKHSDDVCANWLYLPKTDEELLNILLEILK